MLSDEENFDVDKAFEDNFANSSQLWIRLGEKPDFAGKDVMEVGSGLGCLTAAIALEGPASILGVDIWDLRVRNATRKIAQRFPELRNVRFDSTPTDEMAGSDRFDIIVSQNTFEHIDDIDGVLASFRRLLKPGGRAYIGFCPLYHSPFGDHGELRSPVKLPWLHLLAGERRVIEAYNKANGEKVTTLQACGFNGRKPADFMAAFERCGLEIESMRLNRVESSLKQGVMNLCSSLAKIPGLEPYFTFGMYVTLRKPVSQ
jgi:SAM-dependent methyltransferase